MYIEKTAYENLEINKIMSVIADKCRSEIGALTAFAIEPAANLNDLHNRQDLFETVERYRATKGELPWLNNLNTVLGFIAEAEETGVLTGQELIKILNVMKLSMKLRTIFLEEKDSYPSFAMFLHDMHDYSAEIEILSVIDDDGRLYDNASEKLKDIRNAMRSLLDIIRRKGHAILNDPSISCLLQERVMSLRNSRYAFLVRQDALSTFPGIVVDRSGSGNSVYMEPHSFIKLNNEYSASRNKEKNEELKILRILTGKILHIKKQIADAEKILGKIDLFYALSEKIRLDEWKIPQLSERPLFDLKMARHPLLYEKVVPIDIKCGDKYRELVVTGPNTGGKTVALKTAGICVALGWLGFPIPAGEGSKIGDISELFADIGDEQSIEQSLSTFSAHITHITNIISAVTDHSVVLLDELGAGTDPDEGAALGIALLDWLCKKRALVLATTHYNPIKHFAVSADGIETASVEFNLTTLSPTYKILLGIPGRSNALLIASKLGMPDVIIKRAEEAINGKSVSIEDLIGELHEKRAALERETANVEAARKRLEEIKNDYETRVKDIKEKREKLIEDADKKAVNIVRNAENSARALIKNMETADAESSARRELERKRSHFMKIEKSAVRREEKKEEYKYVAAAKIALEEGDTVQLIGTNKTATVVENRGKKVLLLAGTAQIEVPLVKLCFIKKKDKKQQQANVQIKVPRPVDVPSSIMIRHMTVAEAIPLVEQYLDRAYRAGYETVTIIHGRGEGILRREVQELCKHIPYIAEHNLGGPHEGGYGVTVVKFAK
jgi:DNA mismatch repair protein MutS2